jgi:pyruvate, water dikinase
MSEYVLWFDELGMGDVPRVGGKNASLGEMISGLSEAGVQVPGGFATTAEAYREFLRHEGLDKRINELLGKLDVDDINALRDAGRTIREWVVKTPFPQPLTDAIREAWKRLEAQTEGECTVAVRSSATAEDLPDASFAGQQETFLNVRGDRRRASRRSTRCSPPSTTTAPSPTGCTRASIMPRWPCPPASSAWCEATWARAA